MTDRYAKESAQLQAEQQAYLAKVRAGRRVAKRDPADPEFSEAAEAVRQLTPMGLGRQMRSRLMPGGQFSGR